SLAGREREWLHDARKLDARKNRIEGFSEPEGEKLRHRKPRGTQDFALAELVAASLDRFGRVRNQAQGLRGISGRLGRAIAQREDGVHRHGACPFHDALRSLLRLLKVQRQRPISPGVFELMAAIAAKKHLDA